MNKYVSLPGLMYLKYDTFRKYIKPPFSYSMKHSHSNPNNAYSNLRFEDEYRLFGQS